MKSEKSQSAMEFISLASFMFFVIVGFFAIMSSKLLEAREESNKKIAEDIANFAYREIEISQSVNCGYVREFEMPQTVNGVNYSIEVIDNKELVVNYIDQEYVKFLPPDIGKINITKGVNIVQNACKN